MERRGFLRGLVAGIVSGGAYLGKGPPASGLVVQATEREIETFGQGEGSPVTGGRSSGNWLRWGFREVRSAVHAVYRRREAVLPRDGLRGAITSQ